MRGITRTCCVAIDSLESNDLTDDIKRVGKLCLLMPALIQAVN